VLALDTGCVWGGCLSALRVSAEPSRPTPPGGAHLRGARARPNRPGDSGPARAVYRDAFRPRRKHAIATSKTTSDRAARWCWQAPPRCRWTGAGRRSTPTQLCATRSGSQFTKRVAVAALAAQRNTTVLAVHSIAISAATPATSAIPPRLPATPQLPLASVARHAAAPQPPAPGRPTAPTGRSARAHPPHGPRWWAPAGRCSRFATPSRFASGPPGPRRARRPGPLRSSARQAVSRVARRSMVPLTGLL